MRDPEHAGTVRRETLTTGYVLGILAGALFLAYVLRYTLLPFAAAAAIAYAARPLIRIVQSRLRLPRLAAVLIIYVLMLALVGAAGYWLLMVMGERLIGAARQLPAEISRLAEQWAGPTLHLFGETFPSSEIGNRILEQIGGSLAEPSRALLAGGILIAAPATLVLTLVTLFYFLNSGDRIAEGVLRLAPPRYRPDIRALARRVDPVLRRYVVGVLLVVAYTAIVAWLFLRFVFGISYASPLAVVVGVLELVPVIGPAGSMALLGGTALLHGHGVWRIVGLFAFAIALRVSIDEIVGPLLLGRSVALHPVAIIFAFMTGATLFGVLGVLFAVPVASAIRIVLDAWYGEQAAP